MRYFLEFAYKGTHYHGWQYQPNATSVQETLNKAISTILKKEIDLVGAGRTDSGVHASQMFAHFDYDLEFEIPHLIHKLNSFLPKDIALLNIHNVPEEAHARFDAIKRTYQYHIHTTKDAFESDDSWYYHNSLNIELMNEACKILFNYIDFECFSKVHTDVNTFNCKIYEAHWQQIENRLVFTITADRFLRNMVRAIVGTMVNIGLEKVSLPDFIQIIKSKDRNKAGFSVPAHGLYLTKVEYPYITDSSSQITD
jgi:tRNA pseudouridine38-40 synthase